MAIRGFLKFSWKTFLPYGWLHGEYQDLKNQNTTIFTILKRLFSKNTAQRQESFDTATARLNLSEHDIKKMAGKYFLYSILFFILSLSVFVYALYLLLSLVSITGFMLALAASGLCLAHAFKFNFWSYQMKAKKLGVTFDEWMRNILGEKGISHD